MTVKQLIAQLKKYPGNKRVAWKDHDQGENEINNFVGEVRLEEIDRDGHIEEFVIIRP